MPLRIESCPSQFQHQLNERWTQWRESAGEDVAGNTDTLLEDVSLQRAVARSFVGSDFFYRQCCRSPELLPELLQNDDLGLASIDIEQFGDDESLDRELRKLRNRVTAEVIYRDFADQWDIARVCQRLTELAETCIQAALAWHYRQLVNRYGEPRDREGNTQSLIVLGMGKLGARELNLSSDIDLIFAYPEPGETSGENSVDNQKFFQRLGQRLIKSLDAITADGFVFRVDMRLRPYGDSGPLVSHFAALEDYYQTQGREWERYAMVKARPVAGDVNAAAELMELLRPFTYRRYIDFSAIDALREMKTLIQRQVRARGLGDNVKLGRGGIREVEFIVQAFQLIRGGREPALRERNLLQLLPLLESGGHLEPGIAQKLADAYQLLRRVEHALQAERDQQTQTLPAEEERRQKLAFALGRDSWEQLWGELTEARAVIEREFDAVIAPPEDIAPPSAAEEWEALWASCDSEPAASEALRTLEFAGVEPAHEALDLLAELRVSPVVATLPSASRERLDQFMPLLLAAAAREQQPLLALTRVLPLVRAVLRRSAYLVLINENPPVLKQLLRLCAASPWIAERLARHPILLDELLDPRRLLAPAKASDISDELRRELLRVDPQDLEVQMEALRHFKQSQSLRIAAQEVSGALPLMKVSDSLTWLAEAILQQSLQLAWTQLEEKHGAPAGASREDMRFAIIAYGKLGGLELGHGSDLDLVFVHDADPMQYTGGEASIDNLRFYTRLAQRLIHILQTRTLSGPLYEVDTRLRPSGNSGLLVTSLAAFEKYQRENAWTWEHQALVRARPVAGSRRLCGAFEQLRLELLCQPQDEKKLREEVVVMRDKMRAHLDKSNDQSFDLKQGRGGIVDIEFMVQYAALAWAHKAPSIVRYTDNIRILESLRDAGLMPAHQAGHLIDAYKAYRSEGHRLALQQLPGVVSGDQFTAERKTVQTNWRQLLG
ncbi:bifunctional [glutamate--ammonia ligase]-adenylyl-L-tyrosine phosphorylase/[glutamate--ammonia-ligase] adenylyltransferase [Microbulbifer thermotolerans]|uniref:bifunctional [glutamate--ammonia ligase]-adenylyl-L-tyrosine phosphorylase/[glutamate--ammonia-ligase] adenylyltransferase n=1 Tax=Microbulbifer thermotolerans TaxID=252514 RepID=UPI00224A512E|nr:bifunctional [glutamate--ammonia ligase]-adenylyl-L-tyrosine phosphorylase/[glutamate--ammonia-ligase] adenylyltransferase [Microbulbifer thermotolerans]MCX2778150.1 bifunctional [glutamate--ammonia ligase]-adenylyl-L-tyrosine phosphorylase/[glutamate--ammonia-ligase] adenylyltransferase [Microbulbifer thermotolerans]MCX2804498.1 bifunctional [glutamate--ammonia ligase]-adenylyl-L-tyrosine phosphorylase/[glutamate--ammonia-ligase] adenylyltransferase [Microbulbifer thermotolerans]MCX2835205.1